MCFLACLPLTKKHTKKPKTHPPKKTLPFFFSLSIPLHHSSSDRTLQSHPSQSTCGTDAEIEAPEGKLFPLRPVAGSDPTHCPVGTKLTGAQAVHVAFQNSLRVTCWSCLSKPTCLCQITVIQLPKCSFSPCSVCEVADLSLSHQQILDYFTQGMKLSQRHLE